MILSSHDSVDLSSCRAEATEDGKRGFSGSARISFYLSEWFDWGNVLFTAWAVA